LADTITDRESNVRVTLLELDEDTLYKLAGLSVPDGVEVEIFTPEGEFEKAFGRRPENDDRELGLWRLVEARQLALEAARRGLL
jgi:hypothetical protein